MHKEEFHTLPQSVIEFLNYLSVVKSKSELTVLEYASEFHLLILILLKPSRFPMLTLFFLIAGTSVATIMRLFRERSLPCVRSLNISALR